jgi:6-phosphofructokinase 2
LNPWKQTCIDFNKQKGMKIVTLTFSPCIDKTTSVADLIPEKKLRCSEPALDPGGGGINVARAVKKLGGEAKAIYPSGGCTGQLFDKLLADEHVPCTIIRSTNETRENFIVVEEATGDQYRFGTPGTYLYESEWRDCIKAVDEEAQDAEFIVASGSLPPGVPVDVFVELAGIARKRNTRFIVDTSGDALKHAINAGVFLVKPNLNELGALTGEPVAGTEQIAAAARKLIQMYACEVVVVSMGSAGAMMVTKEHAEKIPTPKVEVKSTVGAGDSMVAGIVLRLTRNSGLLEAVQYGVACGSSATMNPGTELCKKEDADMLFQRITELSVVKV